MLEMLLPIPGTRQQLRKGRQKPIFSGGTEDQPKRYMVQLSRVDGAKTSWCTKYMFLGRDCRVHSKMGTEEKYVLECDPELDKNGTMWLTVADRHRERDEPHLRMEKAHVHAYGWCYTVSHHLNVYDPDDSHQRVCSIAALVARFGNMCLIWEIDKDSVVREPSQAYADVPTSANCPWFRQLFGDQDGIDESISACFRADPRVF